MGEEERKKKEDDDEEGGPCRNSSRQTSRENGQEFVLVVLSALPVGEEGER